MENKALITFYYSFPATSLFTAVISMITFGCPSPIYVIGIIVSILVPAVMLATSIREGKENLSICLCLLGTFVPLGILILSMI